jgi:cytochrome P450 family 135
MIFLILVVISMIVKPNPASAMPTLDQTASYRRDAKPRSPCPGSLPPGPKFASAQLLHWTLRPGPWLEACSRHYGDCFTIRTPGSDPLVFLADPAAVRVIFTGDPAILQAGAARAGIQPMFGAHSILLLDGPEHLRERRLMLPPFHGERMAHYGELMTQITERAIDDWPLGRPLALQERIQTITLEAILRVVFGMDEPDGLADMRRHIQPLLALTASPLAFLFVAVPRLFRGPAAGMFDRVLRAVDARIFDQLARRRSDPALAERDDILSLLIQARDEHGCPMSDEQLRDELVTLLLAGHETTATGLAWTFDALLHHPEKLERLTAECIESSDGGVYLEAVLKEALRLRPPLLFADRKLATPYEIAGYRLPAGTVVAPCIYLVHRRAELYPDPEAFRPERFVDEQGGSADTYTWLPFGGGVRRCLGASFALFEMTVVLRTILRNARLSAASRRPEATRRRSIVFAPARGTRAIFRERVTVPA